MNTNGFWKVFFIVSLLAVILYFNFTRPADPNSPGTLITTFFSIILALSLVGLAFVFSFVNWLFKRNSLVDVICSDASTGDRLAVQKMDLKAIPEVINENTTLTIGRKEWRVMDVYPSHIEKIAQEKQVYLMLIEDVVS